MKNSNGTEVYSLEWWLDMYGVCIAVGEYYQCVNDDIENRIRYLKLAVWIQKRIIKKYG